MAGINVIRTLVVTQHIIALVSLFCFLFLLDNNVYKLTIKKEQEELKFFRRQSADIFIEAFYWGTRRH